MQNYKKFYLVPLNAYQYISRLLPGSCRYYPTCSEYTKWHFELNKPHKALVQSTLRILRCNQLFAGGIDYPIMDYTPPKLLSLNQNLKQIKYWFVPKENSFYYVIKDYGAYSK
ncbi:membrane protein insertion efficiency factor YidD [bacterium]|nr:membrane protein insertion efficiency factor YidD [bacterium]MBU1958782.1 membrane protein insertion efficiency factor YidD [bacterium]